MSIDKPINTALCSFGMSGWVFHAPFIVTNPGFKLYGVWERTKNLAAEKYPAVKTYRTLDEILTDPDVELVIVNTPSVTHYTYAKQVLLAGKNVVVEKPFTATVKEAEELVEIARDKSVVLTVYQNRRYDSDYKAVKKVIDKGWLGDIVDAELRYDRFAPGLSYKTHKEVPTAAVGSLYDLGSHLIDQGIQLFGMPLSIFADIAITRPGSQVDDYFDLKMIYPHHRVTVKSSYYVREPLPGYIIHGRLGSFIKNKTDVQEKSLLAGAIPGNPEWGTEPVEEAGLLHTEENGAVIRKHIVSERGNYGEFYDQLYRAIRERADVPVKGEEAIKVIEIIEAAFKSQREKSLVSL
jgi:scyllo-inositol 2-dehydrogenase (NADP+)